jgi:hypothetical protein
MYIREEKGYTTMMQVKGNQLIQKKEKSHIVGMRKRGITGKIR